MSCYIVAGHAFILLSSLTWSWVFDLNTNKWSERTSYLQLRSRITGGVFAFGKWLCGDTLSGNVQEITTMGHTEVTGITARDGCGGIGDAEPAGGFYVRLTVANARVSSTAMWLWCRVLRGVTAANGVWHTTVVDDTHHRS